MPAVAYFCGLSHHETYMNRCLQLARLGAGNVAPNPMVGAVLVYNDTIIGEGYHQHYGQAHAEVNCINSVKPEGVALISSSTLYVSLEPCAHFGKTPPCADLIIAHKIPTVVIGCTDSYHEVDGKGIEKLKAAGVEVVTGVLETEARELNKRFFTYHQQQRPYIILKWAQSIDGKIGGTIAPADGETQRILISNEYSNRLVHKWRSEEAAIMVGTNTALLDNPSLTLRLWEGNNPVRVVIDKSLLIPSTHTLMQPGAKTLVFNYENEEQGEVISYCKIEPGSPLLSQALGRLHQQKILSVLVEGGAALLQSFIDGGYWDEAIIITNQTLVVGEGTAAPILRNQQLVKIETFSTDIISFYKQQIIKPKNN